MSARHQPGRRHRPAPAPSLLLLALAAAVPAQLPAAGEGGFREAVTRGKATVDLRYRYEDVRDEAVGAKHARASTLRTALAYRTRFYRGFGFLLEAENVAVLGHDLYDNGGAGSLGNGVADRPLVADPATTEINQAQMSYRGDRWRLTAGRQEIELGDQRFVGNASWPQNHQSFDALRVDNSSLGGLRFTYVFVDRVHRIAGDSHDLAGHLLNATFDLQNAGRITLYGYLLDFRDAGVSELSTATWGLEFAGERRLSGRRSLLYEIERAEQSDHAGNPLAVDAGYSRLMLGAKLSEVTIELAWERLDGTPAGGGFRTPLATLHRFNGWADKFLATPAAGLEDVHLQLTGKLRRLDWLARYHDFRAASGPAAYGRELDLQLQHRWPGGLELTLAGALYDADGFAADTEKWMLWSSYSF